ncbi:MULTISPECIES: sulfate ABC transporter permease subunit CysT [unclassified Frankia]|uniref:sulfate ABC transporter permease subunit CysT n=1 Tax=unclassified Frankia TaxID=2632575 RepID=UPI0019318DF3|nr:MULTISPECIES: sulfate ABC transporter permease subunit CysT [unclassified Frankia]MBL7488968.1 sulfate ABC transporter permease subunit CysT [Frankia sp. AgW1.1]MBL7622532.1 sulfate ABC transporter permease subunit CysT [Frankia sp. AgB1.8]
MSTLVEPAPTASPARTRVARTAIGAARLGRGSGLGLGLVVLWLSLLVLIPLAAVVARGFTGGWSGFWNNITDPSAVRALRLTVTSSLLVAVINAVMGTLLAWVLVRDPFPGRRLVNLIIDIPFALPTIVAGLVLLAVYGTNSPVGIHLLGTQRAIVLGLLFVTLPFVVRSVQPVLMALDTDAEQAAACLGASPWTTFRRVVLPLLLPAIASGAALAFARAMGEYGSVLLISGGLSRTRVSSMFAYQKIENFDFAAAAATATVLLAVSLLVIIGLDLLQRAAARRG